MCIAERVYKHSNKPFPGFSHWDIALRHTSACVHLMYRAQTPLTLQKLFDEIINNELRGPTLGKPKPSNISVYTPSPHTPMIDQLKDY